jgi:protein-tyrosine-phosphatase
MAEGILKAKWHAFGRNDLFVTSTGIHARENQPAARLAQEICFSNGIDISRHQSRPLNPRELAAADCVFVMEQVQKKLLTLFFPALQDKVFLLGSWPEPESRKGNIPDPIGGSEGDYRRIFELLSAHVDRIIPHLLSRFAAR